MTADSTGLSPAKRRLLDRMLGGRVDAEPTRIGAVATSPGGGAPLSPEQWQVWLHASLAEDQPLYNEPVTIHKRGTFDLARLQDSLNAVLRRHDIWRTAFPLTDGIPNQIVEAELGVTLPLIDLTRLPEHAREPEAMRLATEDAREPFDMARAPLFRARVIKLAPDYHRLHLTLHHIIFDGVSIYRIFLPELMAEYDARSRGGAGAADRRGPQYADYTQWRVSTLQSAAIGRQMAYWREHLAGELPKLRLPYDRPRPTMLSHRGAMETFTLPAGLTETLKELAQARQVTLYMLLLAAFKVLLYRYSGLQDLIVGGAADMRRRPELQAVMGYFLNSLPLRSRPSGAMPFADYLTEVKGVVLDALAASDVPFEQVVRELQPRRDASHHPIFDVLFSMEPPAPAFAGGWDLTQMEVTVGTAKFDLYLELDERPEGIIGRFLYSSDLFDPGTIRRMIGHWVQLLQSIAAEPTQSLASLRMLSAEETDQVLRRWNDTARDVPAVTLPQWFEEQVRRTPDRVALRFLDAEVSYRELDRRADELAQRLRAEAIGRDMLVGIYLERSVEMVVGLLAILKSGAAYLPLDPDLPPARLERLVRDAGCSALLTRRALLERLPKAEIPVLLADEPGTARAPRPRDAGVADPGSLAYVLYTSGSTGQPKGVEVTHRSVVNLLASMQREPGFASDDRLLAVTALSFDIAGLELYLPLVSGGTVVLADHATLADSPALAAFIRDSGCTVMQATPTLWRGLIQAGWRGDPNLKILCGGEALPRSLADALLARSGSLWNLYGPTETTIWSTLNRVERGAGPVPIGRPIANTHVYVLDAEGCPVPVGVPGELHIAGAGVARGYRNQEALTRERFVERPGAPGERLYRTGDRARWRADGVLDFLGRADGEIKLRGFRIAPEEVESALLTHPDVAGAAVTAADAEGEQSLVACIVPRGSRAPEPVALRRHLAEVLPHYMVPSRFVTLSSLPVTPNGKLDRSKLPTEGAARPPSSAETAARASEENRMAEVWREVLRVPEVHPEDDFFEIGGHSMLAAKLLRRIEATFGVRLPMAAFLQSPTLANMAKLVSTGAPRSRPRSASDIPPLLWINCGPPMRYLSSRLERDHPLVDVFLTPEEFGELGDTPSFEAIAARLTEAIRRVQPHGPYYIGGWCTDGILGFEAASQLIRQGETVGLLVLLHSINPVHFRRLSGSSIRVSKLRHHWDMIRQLQGMARWSYIARRLHGAAARLRRTVQPQAPWLGQSDILDKAALAYEPHPYPGAVLLLQPRERPGVLDYRPGWAETVTGSLAAYDCPGDHISMLKPPNIDVLAEHVRAHLKSATSAARPIHAAR